MSRDSRNSVIVINFHRISADKKVAEESGDEPPSPRTIHNVGVHEGRLIVWGGGDTGSAPVQDTALHSLCLGEMSYVSYVFSRCQCELDVEVGPSYFVFADPTLRNLTFCFILVLTQDYATTLAHVVKR